MASCGQATLRWLGNEERKTDEAIVMRTWKNVHSGRGGEGRGGEGRGGGGEGRGGEGRGGEGRGGEGRGGEGGEGSPPSHFGDFF